MTCKYCHTKKQETKFELQLLNFLARSKSKKKNYNFMFCQLTGIFAQINEINISRAKIQNTLSTIDHKQLELR